MVEFLLRFALPMGGKGWGTMTSTDCAVDAGLVTTLAAVVTGPVLMPGDEGFTEECAGFNLLVEHRPAVVVGAVDAFDVQAAVRFAVANRLPVAVHCTGHQPFTDVAGGVLITTGRMATVDIDPVHKLARVGGGALWGQVVSAAAAYGLAALNGSSPTVGVVGYTLGGGFSPILGRTYGWAADHVRAIELVTADGMLRRVTQFSDPELFWAVRGGKSNFGVVTALEFDLFEVTRFYGGSLLYDGKHTASVLHAYREVVARAPKELNSSVALLRMPPLESVPKPLRGKLMVQVRIAHLGSAEEGAELVAPLRMAAPPIEDTLADMPYVDNAAVHQDPVEPMPYRERSVLLSTLTGDLVDLIVRLVGPDSGAEPTIFEIRHLAGALAGPARSRTRWATGRPRSLCWVWLSARRGTSHRRSICWTTSWTASSRGAPGRSTSTSSVARTASSPRTRARPTSGYAESRRYSTRTTCSGRTTTTSRRSDPAPGIAAPTGV